MKITYLGESHPLTSYWLGYLTNWLKHGPGLECNLSPRLSSLAPTTPVPPARHQAQHQAQHYEYIYISWLYSGYRYRYRRRLRCKYRCRDRSRYGPYGYRHRCRSSHRLAQFFHQFLLTAAQELLKVLILAFTSSHHVAGAIVNPLANSRNSNFPKGWLHSARLKV